MRYLALVALALTLVACGATQGRGSLPTHDGELSQAGVQARLSGRPDCLWLEKEGVPPTALIWPPGTTTEREGDDIVVLGQDGQEMARTDEWVHLSGKEADPGTSSCLDENGSDAPSAWRVNAVDEVCSTDEDDCPPPQE